MAALIMILGASLLGGPAPTVSALAPASGPIAGGTTVIVSGTDFRGVTGISFGPTPARSYTVESETELLATSPPRAFNNAVDVRVTTAAGESPTVDSDFFTYEGCSVPRLGGRRLSTARAVLKQRGCRLGRVIRTKGVAPRMARVIGQAPGPGRILAPGTRVRVTLG